MGSVTKQINSSNNKSKSTKKKFPEAFQRGSDHAVTCKTLQLPLRSHWLSCLHCHLKWKKSGTFSGFACRFLWRTGRRFVSAACSIVSRHYAYHLWDPVSAREVLHVLVRSDGHCCSSTVFPPLWCAPWTSTFTVETLSLLFPPFLLALYLSCAQAFVKCVCL